MIKLTIVGQTLSIVTSKVVAGTHSYLEVEGSFRTPDWRELRKWVHFIKGEYNYVLPMHEDRIGAEQHLDLTEGTWEVYVHGNYLEDDEVTERVTTGIEYLYVEGPHDGHPFPPLTPDFEEVLANEVEEAIDIAQSVRDDADAGKFDGATFLPTVSEEGIISWTNDQEKPNPEPRNIKGPKGDVGDTTVQVSVEEPTDPRINVWINPQGMAGKVIVSFELISGSHQPGTFDNYLITFHDGTTLAVPVYNGADGEGTGDMLKSTYDPNNISQDIFAYADEAAGDVVDTTGVTGLLKGSGGAIVPAVAGTDYQTPITIDEAMSGSSTNPVQNNIIKAYVDNNASKIFLCTYGTTTFAEISTALANGKVPILRDTYYGYAIPLNETIVQDGVHYHVFTSTVVLPTTNYLDPIEINYVRVNENNQWTAGRNRRIITTYEVDAVLSSTSENPVQNKIIKQALDGKQNTLTIDNALSGSSTNPVQNKIIKQALDGKASTESIPTALKSPYALTITYNGVATNYDGSQAKSVNITGGGGGALVIRTIETTVTLSNGTNTYIFTAPTVSGYQPAGIISWMIADALATLLSASPHASGSSLTANSIACDIKYERSSPSPTAAIFHVIYKPA